MESTSTLSPPTSWAREARSVVAVIICSLLSARPAGETARVNTSRKAVASALTRLIRVRVVMCCIEGLQKNLLERMRAMRTHHKEKLKQEFVGVRIIGCDRIGKMAEAVLAADLAELAGPVGEDSGKTGVRQICVGGMAAAVKAATDGPAAVGAVLAIGIEAEGMLRLEKAGGRNLVARAPEKFVAEEEGVINGAAQGFPTESGIGAVEIGEETGRIENGIDAGIVVTACVGNAEIEIGGFAEVAISAEMADNAHVLATHRVEQIVGITAEHLSRPFEKPGLGGRKKMRQRETGIVDAVFTPDEIVGHQRPVDERERMIVNGVDLAEVRAHFADFQKKPGGERGERDIGLLDIYAGFAEGDESVGARVGIDDGLQADFGFVHFERGRRRNGVASDGADEVANQADVRIEKFGVGRGASKNLSLRGLRFSRIGRS